MLFAQSLRAVKLKCSSFQRTSPLPQQKPVGSNYYRPRLAYVKRVQFSTSRAISQASSSTFNAAKRGVSKPQTPVPTLTVSSNHGIPLQSAFPKKTFIAFVLLGLGLYYFVDIEDGTWADVLMNTYSEEQLSAWPLHFFESKEELLHWLDFHNADASDIIKIDGFVPFFLEAFDKTVGAWSMTEDDAKEDSIPVTHGCRFQGNAPCEDYQSIGTSPGPGEKPWNFWGIMDGHAGRNTSWWLQRNLVPRVSAALLHLPSSSSSVEIENTIKEAFLRIDKMIMDTARTAASWHPAANIAAIATLAPALSGSCALLAAFDPASSTLRVACTGDSRAVLGRWDPSTQSYTCIPLSEDQTGFNQKEVARLAAAHPDEPDIIDPKSGRMFGIAVTRAFGDHRWKWDNDFVKQVQTKFWGSAPRPGAITQPYMTAEPEVTETDIVRAAPNDKRAKSDFMIMASDGLWDRISSEHAVECVERWLEARDRGKGLVSNDPKLIANPPVFPTNLNATDPGVSVEDGQVDWKATPEYFAIEDDNAAVCLIKNAMGGTRRNLFLGVLAVPHPVRRSVIDDTTIMVVFFDKFPEKKAAEKKKSSSEGGRPWWRPW